MSKLLLVVEDSFQVSGRGVIVFPALSPEAVGSSRHGYTAQVRLARPDATEEVVEATFEREYIGPRRLDCLCVLRDAKKEQVPPDTEIWLLDEVVSAPNHL